MGNLGPRLNCLCDCRRVSWDWNLQPGKSCIRLSCGFYMAHRPRLSGHSGMNMNIKQRQDQIPAATRYLTAVIGAGVAAVAVLGSISAVGDVAWSRYVIYGAAGVALF